MRGKPRGRWAAAVYGLQIRARGISPQETVGIVRERFRAARAALPSESSGTCQAPEDPGKLPVRNNVRHDRALNADSGEESDGNSGEDAVN
jgi:hypothetical protein